MIKLIACAITIWLIYIGQYGSALYAAVISFLVLLIMFIVKSNKQKPDESDEAYAERMARLKESMEKDRLQNSSSIDNVPNTVTDPKYSFLSYNIYHNRNK